MIRYIAVASLVVVSACSTNPGRVFGGNVVAPTPPVVVPVAPRRTAKERLVAALETRGCVLTAENAGPIKVEAVLSDDDLVQATEQLAAEGRAEVSGSGAIRILSGTCT